MSGVASENSRKRPSTRRLAHSADADVFDFGVIEDAVFGPLTSHAGFLDAAERCHLGGDDAGIQSDDTVLDGFRDSPTAREIACIDVSGQAELGVVGHADGLRFGLELK